MTRVVTRRKRDAEAREIRRASQRGIAAGDRYPAPDKEFGECAHAGAGDPYEVDGTSVGWIEEGSLFGLVHIHARLCSSHRHHFI